MKTVNVYKAQPFTKNGEIESVTILIDRTLPEVRYENLDEWRQVAKKEAQTLCEALVSALPQGVTDALLVELLDHKRSLLVIPGVPAAASQPEAKASFREQVLDGKQESRRKELVTQDGKIDWEATAKEWKARAHSLLRQCK